MKKDIQPELFELTATCTCGAQYPTRSTSKNLRTTLCAQCHPFYTGAQKYVDTAGRIEKFQNKYANIKPGNQKKSK